MTQPAETVPPEVMLDLCGRQVLATMDNGQAFRQYVECDYGCGYLIGVGDAWDSAGHLSCWENWAKQHNDGPAECICPQSHGYYNTPSGLRNCKKCHGLLGKARPQHFDGCECGGMGTIETIYQPPLGGPPERTQEPCPLHNDGPSDVS